MLVERLYALFGKRFLRLDRDLLQSTTPRREPSCGIPNWYEACCIADSARPLEVSTKMGPLGFVGIGQGPRNPCIPKGCKAIEGLLCMGALGVGGWGTPHPCKATPPRLSPPPLSSTRGMQTAERFQVSVFWCLLRNAFVVCFFHRQTAFTGGRNKNSIP